jgi:glycosyltransferase involved in cell wall biosynthesis
MKIAIVSVSGAPSNHERSQCTSRAIHVSELACRLGQMGHHVTIYTHRDGLRTSDRFRLAPRVTVEHVSAGNALPMPDRDLLPHIPEFAERLARRWAKDRPDVVHAHHWLSGLAALSATRELGIPVVQTFHDLAAHAPKRSYGREARARLERAIGRGADRVIALTENECTDLVRLGVPRSSIAVVPTGIDIERFAPGGPASPRGAAARIVMLTGTDRRQGTDIVIQAMARVPGAELLIAGGPPSTELEGDEDVHRLRLMAKEAGVADRVTFLGRIGAAEVPALLRSANLTVSVPTAETFGRVPVESMACGTPVIVSAVGGHLDSVIDEVTGVHVRTRMPEELARRIRNLLSEPTRLAALGIAGSDRVRSRYSWERIADETLTAYEALNAVPETVAEEDEEPMLAVAS